jgi:hypothetical protein
MIPGIVLLVIGALLAFFWLDAFLIALKGALILGLWFFGLILFLMGLSQRKARRDFQKALHDEPGDDAPEGNA